MKLTDAIRKKIISEFEKMEFCASFTGGRVPSEVTGWYFHIDKQHKLRQIEFDMDGYRLKYDPYHT